MDTTGERIKYLRNKANMTQSQLADILNVTKASIQKYENGSVVNLKTDMVEKLADIFEVPPSYILGWSEYDKNVDLESLSSDVRFIEEIHKRFGYAGVNLCEICSSLNDEGRRKILFYAEDLSGNPKFLEEEFKIR